MRHWELHLSRESEVQASQQTPEMLPGQQQRSALTNPSLDELVIGNKMPATPSNSSSIVSISTDSIQYTMAEGALLKRTGCYTEASLMAFLASRHPEIPEEHRHSLMIGAVTGAQTAAQLHVLLDGAKFGRDKGSRVTTERARHMLSFCNLGLMSEDHFDPNPQIRLSPKQPTTSKRQDPLPTEELEEQEELEEPAVPAPAEEVSRQEKHHPSGEEDDTETSSRAIELAELEIPGTQPCNRQEPVGKKRERSTSPTPDAYKAALSRQYSFYMSLDERIRQQIEREAMKETRVEPRKGSNPDSQEIPPSPPPLKERKMELPLLLSATAPWHNYHVAHSSHGDIRRRGSATSGATNIARCEKLHSVGEVIPRNYDPHLREPSADTETVRRDVVKSYHHQGDFAATFTTQIARGDQPSPSSTSAVTCSWIDQARAKCFTKRPPSGLAFSHTGRLRETQRTSRAQLHPSSLVGRVVAF